MMATPSSEIIQNLIDASAKINIHAEWSVNEKVAAEKSGAAAIAGLKTLSAMKNAGIEKPSKIILNIKNAKDAFDKDKNRYLSDPSDA